MVFLPAAAPINSYGVDIIVACASACAAYSANGAATQCTGATFALPDGTYYYLGTASALGMTAAPTCAS